MYPPILILPYPLDCTDLCITFLRTRWRSCHWVATSSKGLKGSPQVTKTNIRSQLAYTQ